MSKAFAIDFVRQIIEQTLLEEHIKNPAEYVGGVNQVNLFSFYEQLEQQDEIDRFAERYRDLINQQNRSGLIANGVIVAPENPTMVNINQCKIVPLTFTITFRCTLADRDLVLETLDNMTSRLRGRKVDIAELNNGHLFKVGTFGNNVDGNPKLSNGDFLGSKGNEESVYDFFVDKIDYLVSKGLTIDLNNGDYLYFEENHQIKVANYYHSHYNSVSTTLISRQVSYDENTQKFYIIEERQSHNAFRHLPKVRKAECGCYIDGLSKTGIGNISNESISEQGIWSFDITWEFDNISSQPASYSISSEIIEVDDYDISTILETNEYPDIIFPPEHDSFTKYKVSLSFDSIRCDEPRTLNAEEYCNISLGGSATLVDAKVRLGNDILKVGIRKKLIKGDPNIDLSELSGNELYWLEPLEVPSSNNANTLPNQLLSNAFKTNSHTDSINANLQYTFIVDTEIPLLDQFYDYGRYGKIALDNSGISPNMIFEITEIYNSWGNYKVETFNAKVVESLDEDNTESDVLSLTISFQIQGDND